MRAYSGLAWLLLLVLAPPVSAESWPSFRGPRGDGQAATGLPAGDGALALEARWKQPLGSGYAGIAVEGDLLVTAGRAGDEDVVLALATSDGQERWRTSLGPAYLGHDGSHDGPIATPTISGGRVYAVSANGRLVALELATGAVVWSREIATELEAPAPYYGYGSSPRVVGDLVVLWIGGEVGKVVAFEAATGAVRWQQLEESTDAQSPVVATLAGKEQVVVIGGTNVAGLDPTTGAVLWQLAHNGGGSAMAAPTSSPIVLGGDRIFFKHGAETSMVVKVARDGDTFTATVEREARALARSYSPPALAGDLLFGYSGRFLSALDPSSGELLWRSRDPGDGFLVAVEDQLVVLTKEGSLHLAPASRDGWSESARLEVFDDVAWTPPAVVGSSLFVRSLGGIARVELVRAADATPIATAAIPALLAPLVAELETATDTAAVLNTFLAGKQLPLVDGDQVIFLWRGPGDDLAIAGDMIGMRREEPMRRVGSTDLWWWATQLDRRARVSYVFLVDNEPAPDPSHTRQVASTVLGPDLNWQRARKLQMSWFAMPEWPGLALPANPARGRVDRFELTVPKPGSTTGETLPVRLTAWLPPNYDSSTDRLPVVYVHDRNAFEQGRWPETLDRVVGRTVTPLIAVFVDAPRMADFDDHFVATVVPAVDARFRTATTREGRANVGMGFSAQAALLLCLEHPKLFGRVGLQSYYAVEPMMGDSGPTFAAADPKANPLKVYLEWGAWDLRSPHEGMDMLASGRWIGEKLRTLGFEPIGGEVADTTDFASWRNRVDVLLESLFPLPGTTTTSLDQWLVQPMPAAATATAAR